MKFFRRRWVFSFVGISLTIKSGYIKTSSPFCSLWLPRMRWTVSGISSSCLIVFYQKIVFLINWISKNVKSCNKISNAIHNVSQFQTSTRAHPSPDRGRLVFFVFFVFHSLFYSILKLSFKSHTKKITLLITREKITHFPIGTDAQKSWFFALPDFIIHVVGNEILLIIINYAKIR